MKIIITSPVQHDGEPLEIGEQIDVSKKDAQALIDAGAAELAGGKAKAPAQTPAAPADSEGAGGDPSLGPNGEGTSNPPADA